MAYKLLPRWSLPACCGGGTNIPIILPPDQPVDAEIIGQPIEKGQEWEEYQEGGEYPHRDQDKRISIGRAIIGGDLIPQRIEPEPRLPWIIARLVHHAPL